MLKAMSFDLCPEHESLAEGPGYGTVILTLEPYHSGDPMVLEISMVEFMGNPNRRITR